MRREERGTLLRRKLELGLTSPDLLTHALLQHLQQARRHNIDDPVMEGGYGREVLRQRRSLVAREVNQQSFRDDEDVLRGTPETLDCRAFIRVRKRHKWPSKSNNSVTLFRFTEIDGGLSVSEGAAQFADLLVALHIQTAERKITMKMLILLNKMVLNGTLLALGALAPLAGAAPPFKSFRIPTANSEPEGITLGADGNMWVTDADANQIGRIDLKGSITEFVVPQPLSSPVD